jgi:hypothetical protein
MSQTLEHTYDSFCRRSRELRSTVQLNGRGKLARQRAVSNAVPILAAVALGLSACASNGVQPKSGAGAVSRRASLASLPKLTISTMPLPAGFDQPVTLVGDPAGTGVYFFAESQRDARVFRWDGQKLTSWSVGDPATDTDLQTSAQNSIAAGSVGTIWVGVNSTLIELNTATGKATRTTMAAATASAGAEKRRPPELAGYHPITGIAVAPNGDLAVIRDAAVDVEVRDHATGTFTDIRLSSDTAPSSIAYDTTGSLGIGTLAIASNLYSTSGTTALGGGPLQLVKAGALTATATEPGSTSAAVSGAVGGTVLSRPGGGFVQVPSESNLIVATVSSGGVETALESLVPKAELAVEGPTATVAANAVAVGTKTGLSLFNTTSDTEQDVNFPTFNCDNDGMTVGGTLNGTPPTTTQGPCSQRATAISVDNTGTIWALSSGANDTIARIDPS